MFRRVWKFAALVLIMLAGLVEGPSASELSGLRPSTTSPTNGYWSCALGVTEPTLVTRCGQRVCEYYVTCDNVGLDGRSIAGTTYCPVDKRGRCPGYAASETYYIKHCKFQSVPSASTEEMQALLANPCNRFQTQG